MVSDTSKWAASGSVGARFAFSAVVSPLLQFERQFLVNVAEGHDEDEFDHSTEHGQCPTLTFLTE